MPATTVPDKNLTRPPTKRPYTATPTPKAKSVGCFRMRRGQIQIFVCVFLVAFAGCTAAEGQAKASSTIPPAPPPVVAADTGSISGKTVNEEVLPIEGVGVVIAETRNTTKSDANGAFTFNGIPPGTYTLLTGRAGYQEASKKVDVLAGEITEITITLKGIALPAQWVAVDRYTQGILAGNYIAPAPNDVQTWTHIFALKDDPLVMEDLLFEADWTPTTALGNGIRFYAGIGDWPNADFAKANLCMGPGHDRYACRTPPEKIKQDWACDPADKNSCRGKTLLRPGGASVAADLVGLWPQESINVYTSQFYRMPMPPDYKAPP